MHEASKWPSDSDSTRRPNERVRFAALRPKLGNYFDVALAFAGVGGVKMNCNPAGGLGLGQPPLRLLPSPFDSRSRLTKIGRFGSRLSDARARALRLGDAAAARFPLSESEVRSRSWSSSSSSSSASASDCSCCRMSRPAPRGRCRDLVCQWARRRRSRMWIRVMPRESRKIPERMPTSASAVNERNEGRRRADSGFMRSVTSHKPSS